MKKAHLLSLLVIPATLFIQSCSKDVDSSASVSDDTMMQLIRQSDLQPVSAVAEKMHATAPFRILMNATAAGNAKSGSLPAEFPNNSMLVKEYLNAQGQITGYDVMYKAPMDARNSGGWLWSSYDADGHVIYSASMRGASCNSCHSGQNKLLSGS